MVSAWPEPPNAKSAGARCGVQGTFAVSGYIETLPEPLVKEGLVAPAPLTFAQEPGDEKLLGCFCERGGACVGHVCALEGIGPIWMGMGQRWS